ncbi:MAG: response regulator transcription factor [Bryobacteraceae bacterium]|jgi:DNA-binding response OmpR family regulator
MAHRVLLVEDDPTLRLVIQDNLGSESYQVDVAANGAQAVRRMQAAARPTSSSLTSHCRTSTASISSLAPAARAGSDYHSDRPQSAGGKTQGPELWRGRLHDKPFDPEKLLARIRAVLRRTRPSVSRIRLGAVTIDFLNKQALRGKRAVPFTHREFELLSYLAERRDVVVHRDELLRAVWGYLNPEVLTRTVDFAIARLRRKVEVDRHHPKFIRTAHGDGYCLTGVSDEEVTGPRATLSH